MVWMLTQELMEQVAAEQDALYDEEAKAYEEELRDATDPADRTRLPGREE